jgi:hypothetical protein
MTGSRGKMQPSARSLFWCVPGSAWVVVSLSASGALWACSGRSTDPAASPDAGGSPSTGGQADTNGDAGSGASAGTGSTPGTGAAEGTGATTEVGGASGAGATTSTGAGASAGTGARPGGTAGTGATGGRGGASGAGASTSGGGASDAGASASTTGGASTGTGGVSEGGDGDSGTGGRAPSGGSSSTGGRATTGGNSGRGGSPSTGGTSGTGGGSGSGTGLACGQEPGAAPLAFPCAEGFGRMTSGGRRGAVVHVTNLNDSGAGSFRDAVGQPNRTVVFDVGGVINIATRVVVGKNIYVAGQTAPGGGITIYGNGIAFNGDSGNDIIRYIRVRMGKNGDSGKDSVAVSEGQDYMFDHVSISWGRDGTLDVNGSGIDNLTFQECIIAQGINDTNHSTGGLMQSGKWSMIRSLYIDNKTRNPKARGTHEFINGVLYNWAEHGYIMGDTSGVSECNLVGNYFIYGPSSNSDSHITDTTPTFSVYADDNWVDSNKNGKLDGSLLTDYKTATVVSKAFDYPAGTTGKLPAPDAVEHVIAHVGASLVRDAVDAMLIEQVLSYGSQGQIIVTEDDNGIAGNVGTVASGTPPVDSDRDGMPDDWESTRGLDPNTPDDSGDDDADGYTNIEEYLSCLVGEGDC